MARKCKVHVFRNFPFYFELCTGRARNGLTASFPPEPGIGGEMMRENYVRAWTIGKMGVYFKNSIILTAATLFVSAIIGSMASYILAKYTFKGKSFVYILFLAV